ncbi:uncharacterized protein DS421_7g200230 [Arachis hypogaea]|nr:uncharacterized protein DS421_7g200230 [Arachis hypogaea]
MATQTPSPPSPTHLFSSLKIERSKEQTQQKKNPSGIVPQPIAHSHRSPCSPAATVAPLLYSCTLFLCLPVSPSPLLAADGTITK